MNTPKFAVGDIVAHNCSPTLTRKIEVVQQRNGHWWYRTGLRGAGAWSKSRPGWILAERVDNDYTLKRKITVNIDVKLTPWRRAMAEFDRQLKALNGLNDLPAPKPGDPRYLLRSELGLPGDGHVTVNQEAAA